jgi:hypothetical protein
VRTLQRHIQQWRVLHGPDGEVMFAQQHVPGERGQSAFTHMEDVGVTLAGVPFPHLVHHFVLTYSNVEAVSICFSESFEALAEGIEKALWQIGGVPSHHRTDHLTAAVKNAGKHHSRDWTKRYDALMAHYGMPPTKNNVSIAHENGDVEQSHHQVKQAVDQALRVRASRDFPSREAYERFLQDLVRTRNLKRSVAFAQEGEALQPLPTTALAPSQEIRVTVSQFSTIQVKAIMRDKSVPVNPVKSDEKRITPQECRRRISRIIRATCSMPEFPNGREDAASRAGPPSLPCQSRPSKRAPTHLHTTQRGLDLAWSLVGNPPGGDAERAAADGRGHDGRGARFTVGRREPVGTALRLQQKGPLSPSPIW